MTKNSNEIPEMLRNLELGNDDLHDRNKNGPAIQFGSFMLTWSWGTWLPIEIHQSATRVDLIFVLHLNRCPRCK